MENDPCAWYPTKERYFDVYPGSTEDDYIRAYPPMSDEHKEWIKRLSSAGRKVLDNPDSDDAKLGWEKATKS